MIVAHDQSLRKIDSLPNVGNLLPVGLPPMAARYCIYAALAGPSRGYFKISITRLPFFRIGPVNRCYPIEFSLIAEILKIIPHFKQTHAMPPIRR